MSCVYVETCRLKGILSLLAELPPHNWLITDLECYDTCGWDGCEKWGEHTLFLSDEELRHDVEGHDMMIVWGTFSAIPVEYTLEIIRQYPLSELDGHYMSNKITPRHPLAILELYVDEDGVTLVSSHDAALLQPLRRLRCKMHDEEAYNKVMNAQLRRIQDILRENIPNPPPEVANAVQWAVWHHLFKKKIGDICDHELQLYVMDAYSQAMQNDRLSTNYQTFWNPYLQE